jgi:hypothetical protein
MDVVLAADACRSNAPSFNGSAGTPPSACTQCSTTLPLEEFETQHYHSQAAIEAA